MPKLNIFFNRKELLFSINMGHKDFTQLFFTFTKKFDPFTNSRFEPNNDRLILGKNYENSPFFNDCCNVNCISQPIPVNTLLNSAYIGVQQTLLLLTRITYLFTN